MSHITLPRALARVSPSIRAQGADPAATLAALTQGVSTLRGNVEAGLRDHRDQLDNLTTAMNAMQGQFGFNGIAPDGGAVADPEYTTAFASYTRGGDGTDLLRQANATGDRAVIQNAMSIGSNTDGGYLAPVEWDRRLRERQRATSPMRRLATVEVVSVGAFTSLWSNDTWGSGWVGETAARSQTTTPSLSPIPFNAGEIFANAAITARLLDDAQFDINQWLINSLDREFGRQENIAFLAGDGINKPNGLLTYAPGGTNAAAHPGGAIGVSELDIDYNGLVDFTYGLAAPYRQNATWLMSSLTAAAIAKLKDANDQPIWREGLIVGQPATLLGRPVEIDEGMPAPTAGNLAIAYGDFRIGYTIVDRMGTRILRDPFSAKPFVLYYATKRVGAGVSDPNALRFLKAAA